MFCNVMTGGGFGREIMGEFSLAWLSFAVIFFAWAFAKRWLGDLMPFDAIGSLVGGMGAYLVVVTVTCSVQWALLIGIIGLCLGGFGTGFLTGGDDERFT